MWGLLVLYFVWSICFGGLYLLSGVVALVVSDSSNRGAAFTINSFAFAFGSIFLIIMAPIADLLGTTFVFNIIAALLVFPLIIVSKIMSDKLV